MTTESVIVPDANIPPQQRTPSAAPSNLPANNLKDAYKITM